MMRIEWASGPRGDSHTGIPRTGCQQGCFGMVQSLLRGLGWQPQIMHAALDVSRVNAPCTTSTPPLAM